MSTRVFVEAHNSTVDNEYEKYRNGSLAEI